MLFLCGVFSASRVLYILFDAKDVKMEIQAQVPSINFQAYFTKTWTRHFFTIGTIMPTIKLEDFLQKP